MNIFARADCKARPWEPYKSHCLIATAFHLTVKCMYKPLHWVRLVERYVQWAVVLHSRVDADLHTTRQVVCVHVLLLILPSTSPEQFDARQC